jgi:hypothetical protein
VAKAGRLPAALTRRYDVYFVPEERAPAADGEAGLGRDGVAVGWGVGGVLVVVVVQKAMFLFW